jgi:Flp pilus assembly pilin Flp
MNATIRRSILRLRRDERGLTTVEYAIVLCLIAALAVGTWQLFGTRVNDSLTKASNKINTELTK